MYNIVICDDNKKTTENLRRQISTLLHDKIESISTCNSSESLSEFLGDYKSSVDVVFMDIDLGNANGIEIAKKIKENSPLTQIIFVSGYDKYFTKVYDVEHVYFIKKPITVSALSAALDKALEHVEKHKRDVFIIKTKKKIQKLPLDSIYCFEKNKRQIIAITSEGPYSFVGKFDEIMSQLNKRFMRCHNSYIVNFNYVKGLQNNCFFMANNSYIPISKTYKQNAKENFMNYIDELIQ